MIEEGSKWIYVVVPIAGIFAIIVLMLSSFIGEIFEKWNNKDREKDV